MKNAMQLKAASKATAEKRGSLEVLALSINFMICAKHEMPVKIVAITKNSLDNS